ncbi:uncharacterized protein LOC141850304 [Brevipalpus obovatus]|uniref:uncharacterized protein LOC141850304 n=1 Tax=Brevipalpus obovatus TaxID=246614 RepID=UPI003D9E30DA
MISKKLRTLEDELLKCIAKFFQEFGPNYLFLLTTKDYNPKAVKEFYCLCFNDTDEHGEKSPNYLIEGLERRRNFEPGHQPPPCKYASKVYTRVGQLADHYLQDHTLKLHEFFVHLASFNADFPDQRMVVQAFEILSHWQEKEKMRKKNSPQFKVMEELKEKNRMRMNSSNSKNFSRNQSDAKASRNSQRTSIKVDASTSITPRWNLDNSSYDFRYDDYSDPMENETNEKSQANIEKERSNLARKKDRLKASLYSEPSGPRYCQKSSSPDVPQNSAPQNHSRNVVTRQSSGQNTRKPQTPLVRGARAAALQNLRCYSSDQPQSSSYRIPKVKR